jgi:hypothetical protein
MFNYSSSSPTVSNCILWGNTAASDGNEIALVFSSTIDVNYCDIKDGNDGIYNDGTGTVNWGPGNINCDPYFADPCNNDYHLQSQAGRWDPNSQNWVTDSTSSPCIDAGNPGYPPDAEPLPNGNRINMGAYGGTSQASKSPESSPESCRDLLTPMEQALFDRYVAAGKDPNCWCWQYQCYGDASNAEETIFLSGTFRIYQQDLGILISSWAKDPETGADPAADFDHGSGGCPFWGCTAVYQQDLNIMINNWQKTTAQLTDCPTYIP